MLLLPLLLVAQLATPAAPEAPTPTTPTPPVETPDATVAPAPAAMPVPAAVVVAPAPTAASNTSPSDDAARAAAIAAREEEIGRVATAVGIANAISLPVLIGAAVGGFALFGTAPGAGYLLLLPVVGVPATLLVTTLVTTSSTSDLAHAALGTMVGHYGGVILGGLGGAFVGGVAAGIILIPANFSLLGNSSGPGPLVNTLVLFTGAAIGGGVGAWVGGSLGASFGADFAMHELSAPIAE